MPTRRALLQSLAAIPLTSLTSLNGETITAATFIPPGHYIIFFDERVMDADWLANCPSPPGVWMDFIPVRLRTGQTIEDAVKIYKLDEK